MTEEKRICTREKVLITKWVAVVLTPNWGLVRLIQTAQTTYWIKKCQISNYSSG